MKSIRLTLLASVLIFSVSCSVAQASSKISVAQFGGSGLFHSKNAQIMPHGLTHFVGSTRMEYFTAFGIGAAELDKLAFTGSITWIPLRYLEAYYAFNGLTNMRKSNAAAIHQIGNHYIGVKGGYEFVPWFTLGLDFEVESLAPVGDFSGGSRAWSYTPTLLFTFDLGRIWAEVPLKLHGNVGFKIEADDDLLPRPLPPGIGILQQTLLDIVGVHRVQGRLGIEFYFDQGLVAFEYSTLQSLENIPFGFVDQTNFVTIGGKWNPGLNQAFTLDLAVDVGLGNDNPQAKYLAYPDWNAIFGFTIASFAGQAVTPAKAKQILAAVSGTVHDENDQPLEGAIVKVVGRDDLPGLVTGKDGKFITHLLPVGEVELAVSKDGYVDQQLKTQLDEAGKEKAVKAPPVKAEAEKGQPAEAAAEQTLETGLVIKLQKKEEAKGKLLVKFFDTEGKPLNGKVSLPEYPKVAPFEVDTQRGGLLIKLKPGKYELSAAVEGYETEKMSFEVKSEAQAEGVFNLRRKGKVELKEGKITILEKVHFKSGKAEVEPNSLFILNEVADLMLDKPQIKKVEVQGHTDSTGKAAYNKALSQRRAEAVMKHLVGRGIDSGRLTARGYGQEQPIAPNATRAGRALNRRVEFKIVE